MNPKTAKIFLTALTAAVVASGFQALVFIANLNQFDAFVYAAFALYVALVFKVVVAYDVHFRYSHLGAAPQTFWREGQRYLEALLHRTRHLWTPRQVAVCVSALFLPTITFWSTVILVQIHLGHRAVQQAAVLLSTLMLTVNYWYVREVFSKWREMSAKESFVRMTVVKIYAAAITYIAALALMRRYCLDRSFFVLFIFTVSFLLVYQSLFNHRLLSGKNTLIALLVALLQGIAAYFVYRFWGLNFFTGGIMLGVLYNLSWGLFHYHLDHALTRRVFFEALLICLLIAAMVFNVTNFHERLVDSCRF